MGDFLHYLLLCKLSATKHSLSCQRYPTALDTLHKGMLCKAKLFTDFEDVID